ncbi:reprolysin-like metallopeptidase [Capnocytophaga leadbetteri]|uniref:reprolysin-like metallopeptidase n=1 Tax=Capnocytophaga leadbetteri TaxID=327575 RepID=UPI0026EE00AA|nr:M12 family metallo-peptidase [Capnocytophaga leadbetteri]
MKILRLLIWFLFIGTINAQQNAAAVIRLFQQNNAVEWHLPVKGKSIPLMWYERHNSLAQEGFRTFVAYHQGAFAGSISVAPSTISGEVWHEGKAYFLSAEKGILKISTEKSQFSCGTCADGQCNTDMGTTTTPKASTTARGVALAEVALPSEDKRVLYNTNVMRTYRLAMLIDYSFYKGHCRSDMNKVKAFMTEVQAGLNEVCGREIGCQFELVNDPRLIITTKEKEVYDRPSVRTVVERATGDFNSLIGEENYDAGIVFSVYKDNRGLAHLGEITGKLKGGCIANHEFYIILHEFGHLLGSAHTFTIGGQTASSFTEPDRGNSIMSYINDPYGTYFSLPSIYTIRNRTNLHDAYYSDKARTQLVGLPQANIPYGEVSDNRAPVIHRAKLKKSYTLPPNTYFQFDIEASDPDGDPLLYMAHQADFKIFGKARFPSNRPTESNRIEFYQPYRKNRGTNEWEKVKYKFTDENETGVFTFWLGVCDGKVGAYKNGKPHVPLYDVYETKVNIVGGTPFRITNVSKSSANKFKYGKETTIFWDVDKNIFGEDSKVRILFSDDYGKSYKYVLADGIPNNGKATVIFPAQTKGWKGGNLYVEGLFKIEVLNHIAYAVSSDTPRTLDMHSPDITFKNLPEPTITVKKNAIPAAPNVTAESYCKRGRINIVLSEEPHDTYLLRQWIATNGCGDKVTAQQFIYYEKEAPINSLHFVGDLPKDMHVQCKGEIPEKATVKAEGADNIRIDYEEEMTEGDKKAYKLTRSWIAYADNALPIRHTQQILLRDTKRPELSAYPKSMIVKSEDEVPFKENLTATDNCDGLLRVDSSESSKYDDKGKKKEVTYVWFVEDNAHNENRYVQVITINPAITTPTVVTPTVSTPTVTTPTVTTPTVTTPTVSTPTVSTPTVSTPTVSTPTVSTPTVSTPTVSTPTVSTPTVSTPTVSTPTVSTPTVSTPTVSTPTVSTPTVSTPTVSTPTVNTPTVSTPTVTTPTVSTPTVSTPTVSTPTVSTPTVSTPTVSTPTVNTPTVTTPTVSTPTVSTPTVSTPTVTTPTVSTPTVSTPTEISPEVSEVIIYNGVSTHNSHNYFKVENTDENRPIYVVIFDEMGLKVYENPDYGKPEVFRGYANVKNVIGKKALAGTYFYILRYYKNNTLEEKKGFLYIR